MKKWIIGLFALSLSSVLLAATGPLEVVIDTSTFAQTGNIKVRVDDALGVTVTPETPQHFSPTMSVAELRQYLESLLLQAEINSGVDSVPYIKNSSDRTASIRSSAKAVENITSADGIKWRALALILLDEFNTLRQRDRDRSVDVAAATSLADLKTRWAARSTLDDRTIQQLKNAYENKIDAGSAD